VNIEEMAFRIAFRHEGEFVNAYFAQAETMDGALLLGSIRQSTLDKVPGAFKSYQLLMRELMEAAAEEIGITAKPKWLTRRAPPHERSPESRAADPPGSSYRVDVPDDVKATMLEKGHEIADALPGDWGYCLLIFTFGEGGTMTWCSNAQRKDMLLTLQEFLRTEGE